MWALSWQRQGGGCLTSESFSVELPFFPLVVCHSFSKQPYSPQARGSCIQVRNCKRIYLIRLLCFDSFGSVTVSHTKHASLNPFRSALMVFSRPLLISPAPSGLLLHIFTIWEFIQSPSHFATFRYMNYRSTVGLGCSRGCLLWSSVWWTDVYSLSNIA